MGIRTYIDEHDPTIALGTTQVNLLELTSSYAVILNNGKAIIPYSIKEIKDNFNEKTIYKRKNSKLKTVIPQNVVNNMRILLKDVVINGTGKKAYIKGLNMGGKTGTTQNYADAWFIGYANDIVIGIWVGNDNNSGMEEITGGEIPSILWKKIVENLL
jgi:penicillin-binding protein 1A